MKTLLIGDLHLTSQIILPMVIKTTLSIYSHLYTNVNFELADNKSGAINYRTSKKTI